MLHLRPPARHPGRAAAEEERLVVHADGEPRPRGLPEGLGERGPPGRGEVGVVPARTFLPVPSGTIAVGWVDVQELYLLIVWCGVGSPAHGLHERKRKLFNISGAKGSRQETNLLASSSAYLELLDSKVL